MEVYLFAASSIGIEAQNKISIQWRTVIVIDIILIKLLILIGKVEDTHREDNKNLTTFYSKRLA